jgi:hypothetical protein
VVAIRLGVSLLNTLCGGIMVWFVVFVR